MYRILLVDDEPRQVKAMANIIKQLMPEYEILTAQDGQEALDVINQNRIDILMTDIRMPNMDGLQLIEKLSEREHSIRIVILSGYGEFEYAQKAIRFGVNDYLVKPISKSDLEDLLLKVEKSIQEERQNLEHQENLKKKLNSSLPVYLEHQLNKWVCGSLDDKGISEIASIFPFKGYGCVVITSLSKFEQFSVNRDIEERNAVFQSVKYLMKETLDPIGHSISFWYEGTKGTMATILNTSNQFNLLSYENSKRLTSFINSIKNEYGIAATIGISEKSDNIFAEVSRCFNEALKAVERRFYLGLGKIIYFSSLESYDLPKTFNLSALESDLCDAVRRMDRGSIIKCTATAFDNINANCSIEPQKLKEDMGHMLLNLIKSLNTMMPEAEYNSFVEDAKGKIAQCEDYKELWHLINLKLEEAADILCHAGSDKNSLIIQKCKRYIDENYAGEISLESVAQKYFFNPSYFSNLFKNYTGLGFSEYLLKVRIKMAQDLLKSTGDSMAEVASKVGFKDPTYFNRMFKRETGTSPLKYRQMNEK